MGKYRNGKLDIIKFIMTINIVALHYWWRPSIISVGNKELAFGRTGYYAVVFFFLVSGALLTRTYYYGHINQKRENSIGRETQIFIYKKMRRFIPLYILALSFYILKDLFVNRSIKSVLENTFYTIPSCLLLGHTGFDNKGTYIGGYYVGASWYLSALIIMILIIYPVLAYNYDLCTKVVAPIVLVASLYVNISVLGIPIVDSRLYPVIPFVLGIIIGDISIDALNILEPNIKIKVFLFLCELFCMATLQLYLCLDISEMHFSEYPMLFITAMLVCIVCMNITPGKNISNSLTNYLGELGMALYLIHGASYEMIHDVFIKDRMIKGSNMDFFISLFISIMIATLWIYLKNRIHEKRRAS